MLASPYAQWAEFRTEGIHRDVEVLQRHLNPTEVSFDPFKGYQFFQLPGELFSDMEPYLPPELPNSPQVRPMASRKMIAYGSLGSMAVLGALLLNWYRKNRQGSGCLH